MDCAAVGERRGCEVDEGITPGPDAVLSPGPLTVYGGFLRISRGKPSASPVLTNAACLIEETRPALWVAKASKRLYSCLRKATASPGSVHMPKKKAAVRNPWTKDDVRELKAHSKARTPVATVAKAMKRTEGAVRQKAKSIGIGLGHRR